MNSLERRFVVGLAVVLLAVFAVLFLGAVAAVKSLGEAYVTERLAHDAESLLAAVVVDPAGLPRLAEGRITPIYQQPLSGHYFQLALPDGRKFRSRSLWDEDLPSPDVAPGVVVVQHSPGPGGQQLMLRAAGYRKGEIGFTLAVAEDLTPLNADIRRFQRFALLLLGIALLAIVLIQRYVLRRGFRALDQVRDEMRQIAAGDRQRLQATGPVEVQPLTAEVNRLLGHLEQRLVRSRQALGNLAHALKAPLSLVTRELDTLPLDEDARKRLADQLGRISGLIERELKRARFAGDGAGQRFVPRRHVPELLEALRRLHRDRALEIRSGGLPDAALPFDQEDMLELLGNLLDNACKWARHAVVLDITLGPAMTLRVADDGPGVPDGDLATLLRRGGRLDEQHSGHGLGLAIVNDLVSDYRGRLELARSSELGGLEVRVTLPLAHPADADR